MKKCATGGMMKKMAGGGMPKALAEHAAKPASKAHKGLKAGGFVRAAASGSNYIIMPGEGILVQTNLYGAVTTTASVVVFYG